MAEQMNVKRQNSRVNSSGDAVVDLLRREGFPVNRANYLAWAFMDPKITPDTDLGAELEMEMPEELRHPNHRAR